MKRVILTMLVLTVLGGCAGDFSPVIEDTSGGDTIGMTSGMDDGTTGGMDDGTTGDETDGGSTGGETDGGTDGSTGGETDGGSTGGDDLPGPWEPCDPIAAFLGDAPCADDPENPQWEMTCVPVYTEPLPNMGEWQFLCRHVVDTQGDGSDILDPCFDNGGDQYAGCFNSACVGNGLSIDPDTDEHVNFPPGQCEFGDPNSYLVKGCCSPFCDAQNPCDPGWTCDPLFVPIDGVGACVWKG